MATKRDPKKYRKKKPKKSSDLPEAGQKRTGKKWGEKDLKQWPKRLSEAGSRSFESTRSSYEDAKRAAPMRPDHSWKSQGPVRPTSTTWPRCLPHLQHARGGFWRQTSKAENFWRDKERAGQTPFLHFTHGKISDIFGVTAGAPSRTPAVQVCELKGSARRQGRLMCGRKPGGKDENGS